MLSRNLPRNAVLWALALAGLALTIALGACGSEQEREQAAASAAPAAHAAAAAPADWAPQSGLPLSEPVQLRSRDGQLRVRLEAKRGQIEVSGSPVTAQPFNGQLVGPTLRVRPGDTLSVTFVNATDAETNIHYHGMHVRPTGISDNVFRTFEPGRTVQSVIRLPADHAPGTYWYHVHLHGLTEGQVMGGLSGLLVVEGLERLLPRPLQKVKQRQLAIRDLQTTGDTVNAAAQINPQGPTVRLVNGLLRPRFSLAAGETQLWRIGNIGSDLFYDVALEGHRMTVVAEDGSPVWRATPATHLVLAPGKRYDVLVQGGRPGTYSFDTLPYDEGFEAQPRTQLAQVTVTGSASGSAPRPAALPRTLETPSLPLGRRSIAAKRTFTFSFGTSSSGGFEALINGEQFDPAINNVVPILGTVEQWTLINRSDEDHPFHIHVNDFQVMSVNGKPRHANGLQDVVVIPKNGGRVVILNPFDDFTGHYVFHCHILGHEDAGMMQTVDVVRRGERPKPPPGGGMAHQHME